IRATRRAAPASAAWRKVICMFSPLDRVGGAAHAPRIAFAGAGVRAVRCDRQPMPPGPQIDLQANSRRLQALRPGLLAGLAALLTPRPARAQDQVAPGLVAAGEFSEDAVRERDREQEQPKPSP